VSGLVSSHNITEEFKKLMTDFSIHALANRCAISSSNWQKFQKRSPLFIRTDNETLSVATTR
jgi:hypothetical protein